MMKEFFKTFRAALVLSLIFAVSACQNLNTPTSSSSDDNSGKITVNEIFFENLDGNKISLSDVKNGTKTSMTAIARGSNFNLAETITIQLYDSDNKTYGNSVSVDESNIGDNGKTFSAAIQIPDVDDEYTLKILIKQKEQEKTETVTTASFQVYSAPAFASFVVPDVGIPYANGKSIIATVTGKNFTAPNVSESNFKASWESESAKSIFTDSSMEINIIDYTKLTVTFTIPGKKNQNAEAGSEAESAEAGNSLIPGNYTLRITYTNENQQTESGDVYLDGILNVKDTNKYSAGQIILSDDSCVESSSYNQIDTTKPPVAVLFLNGYGIPYGAGLRTSSEVTWAERNSEGFSKEFKDIFCTPNATGKNAAETAAFYGDLDGSDNWDKICNSDENAKNNAETNYPAFNWASKYGSAYASQLGSATSGWYMPSLAELCSVYKSLEAINSTLALINKLENGSTYADKSLGEKLFWSSSQTTGAAKHAWAVYFKNGSINRNYKDSSRNCVLVIRAVKMTD